MQYAVRQRLLAAAVERVEESHHGADGQETGEQTAERLVREECQRSGWQEKDLPLLASRACLNLRWW